MNENNSDESCIKRVLTDFSEEEEEHMPISISHKTLDKSLEHVFDNKICTDVTFLVGPESTPIKCHKLILISRSSAFKAMFDGPIAEKGDVRIEDAEEEHFKMFLRFLYTDAVILTANCVAPLVYLAEKYDIGLLKKQCEGFLEANLQIENACKTLEIANTYNMTKLLKVCLGFIGLKSQACFESPGFLELHGETVDLITKSETLNCQEERIFEALDRWAGVQCSKRKMEDNNEKKNVIHKYLKNIRFPLISHQYVLYEVSKYNYFTQGEILEILISDKDPQNTSFNSNPRLGFKGDVVVRFNIGETNLESTIQGGEVNAISFKVSHHSWLYGALVYGSPREQHSIVELRVTHGNEVASDIARVKRNVIVGTHDIVHTILFEAPVYIPANEEHTIYLGLFGADENEFYRYPSCQTQEPNRSNKLFSFGQTVGTPVGHSHIIHKSDGIENVTGLAKSQVKRRSVTRSFRHKSVHFYNRKLTDNQSSIYVGQIPGLLLF